MQNDKTQAKPLRFGLVAQLRATILRSGWLVTNELGSLVGASFADIFNAFGFPAASVTGSACADVISRVMSRRANDAREIFLQEIASGAKHPNDPGDIDEFVPIVYRYLHCAQEGTARLNLRLMARVVKSQMEGKGLYASDFLRYAGLLSSLTRPEIIVLATRHRVRKAFEASRAREDWSDIQAINGLVLNDLVPRVFKTQPALEATMTSLQRTGMVMAGGTAVVSYDAGHGGTIWIDSPLLDEIVALARIEGALQAEDDLKAPK